VSTWTLTELADLAARALDEGGVQVASGRVTGVPDARLIRWYTTIGLLDRPTLGPGRIARYGRRHLLQLVAVKRLQAQGLALAQIQQRLAGATDDRLRAVADLPDTLSDGYGGSAPAGGERRTAVSTVAAEPDLPAADSRFWTARAAHLDAGPASTDRPARVDSARDTDPRVYGVRLHGLTLLMPAEPAPQDLPDIAAAARPLLDLLAARGLLDPSVPLRAPARGSGLRKEPRDDNASSRADG